MLTETRWRVKRIPTQSVRLPPQRALHLGQVLFGVVHNERFDHLGHSHLASLGGDASLAALGSGVGQGRIRTRQVERLPGFRALVSVPDAFERDRHRVGAHAVARGAAGGVGRIATSQRLTYAVSPKRTTVRSLEEPREISYRSPIGSGSPPAAQKWRGLVRTRHFSPLGCRLQSSIDWSRAQPY